MKSSDQDQGKPQDGEGQVPAANGQDQSADRTASRRRWLKAVAFAAAPLIITVKPRAAWAKKHKNGPNAGGAASAGSQY